MHVADYVFDEMHVFWAGTSNGWEMGHLLQTTLETTLQSSKGVFYLVLQTLGGQIPGFKAKGVMWSFSETLGGYVDFFPL